MNRKVWKKPKLVVLFRGRPEEAVLQTCKWAGMGGPQRFNCYQSGWTTNPCSARVST